MTTVDRVHAEPAGPTRAARPPQPAASKEASTLGPVGCGPMDRPGRDPLQSGAAPAVGIVGLLLAPLFVLGPLAYPGWSLRLLGLGLLLTA